MIKQATKLSADTTAIAELGTRYGISKLMLFGSALRDDFTSSSDVDLLVEFLPGHTPGFLGLEMLEDDLQEAFAGRDVDLNTPGMFKSGVRSKILSQAKVIYER